VGKTRLQGVTEMGNKSQEQIIDAITGMLDKGIIPWKKTWKGAKPRNADGRAYTGINHFLLACSGYELPRWLTYNKAKELGGNVKQGEKGTHVTYFNMSEKVDEVTGKISKFPLLRIYTVFNESQCENIELPEIPQPKLIEAESIIQGYVNKPKITLGFSHASYSPSSDSVFMPAIHQFDSANAYYSTFFHELIHSTGHKDRLSRKSLTEYDGFGGMNYSEEELVAEFGSAFLCAESGIDNTIVNSAAYIQGWLKAFKDNPNMLIKSASAGQKASDYILGSKSED